MSTRSTAGSTPFLRRAALGVKRAFDVGSCLAVASVALPAFPLMALLVKQSSPGPLFFVQERVGLRQRTFPMYKFRTMAQAPPGHDASLWSAKEEARITRVGRFFRDYGLDELPQILNILAGDMSVIGPRPPLPSQLGRYTDEQRRMFDMAPGVLSLAAVKGRRSLSTEERIRYHVWYVDHWSLGLDLEILWSCMFVVLGKKNANEISAGQ